MKEKFKTNVNNLHFVTKILMVLALLIVVVVLLNDSSDFQDVETNQVVSTYKITENVSDQYITVSGNLESAETVVISAESGGAVRRVYLDTGDYVERGQLIAIVDYSELSASLSKLQAMRAQSMAQLEAVKLQRDSGINQAELSLELAETSEVNSSLSNNQQTQDSATIALNSGKSIVANAVSAIGLLAEIENTYRYDIERVNGSLIKNNFTQATKLLLGHEDTVWWEPQFITELNGGLRGEYAALIDSEYTSSDILDILDETYMALLALQQAQDSFKPVYYQVTERSSADRVSFETISTIINESLVSIPVLKQQVSGSQIAKDSYSDSHSIGKQLAEDQLKSAKKSLNQQVVVAESGVKVLEQQIREVEVQIENAHIRAPFAGVIADRYISTGEFVGLGVPLFKLVQQEGWKIKSTISDVYNEQVNVGDPIVVEIDGLSGTYAGYISSISPALNQVSKKIAIEISLEEIPKTAKVGLVGSIKMPLMQSGDVYGIPKDYVRYDYRGAFIVDTQKQYVPIRIVSEGDHEIRFRSSKSVLGMVIISD